MFNPDDRVGLATLEAPPRGVRVPGMAGDGGFPRPDDDPAREGTAPVPPARESGAETHEAPEHAPAVEGPDEVAVPQSPAPRATPAFPGRRDEAVDPGEPVPPGVTEEPDDDDDDDDDED